MYFKKKLSRNINKEAVIIDGVRTPFVKSFGVFQNCTPVELFSRVIQGLLRKHEFDHNELDEVICGAVIPQTKNPNVARDAASSLGLASHVHGYTLNRACTSSLQSIADATRSIAYGSNQLILAGGVECLSDVPITYSDSAKSFLLKMTKAKSASQRLAALSDFSIKDWIPKPPSLSEPMTGYTMGEHAEMMAKLNEISRESQDEFALSSHLKAAAAQEAGFLAEEIIPIWPSPQYAQSEDQDNMIRKTTSLEALSGLKPVFDRKNGSISAGNSSPLTDGASVSLIADREFAKSLGLAPRAKIKDVVFVGVESYPQLLLGPAIAIPLICEKNSLSISDIDFFEIHEAFAAQVLSCHKSMADKSFCEKHLGMSQAFGEIPLDKINVNGGAIAIGHPFGATGSRLVTSMTNQLHRADKNLGLIAICAAGGMAGAALVERI